MIPFPHSLRLAGLAVSCAAVGLACMPTDDRGGTAVGNPGNMDVSVSGSPENVTLETARLAVDGVTLIGCAGFSEFVPYRGELDALRASLYPVELPAGHWCSAFIDLPADVEKQLFLTGFTATGTTFEVTINPGVIRISQVFVVNGNQLLVGLPVGSFLTGEAVDSLAGPEEDVDLSDTAVPEEWEDSLETGSLIYNDVDLDGVITADDDLEFADGDPTPSISSGAGCGCAQGGAAGGGLAALLTGLLLIRRRERRR